MRTARAIRAVGALLTVGCYQYQAAPRATPVPVGQEVRLELTDLGRVAIARMAGEGVDTIDGIVDSFADTIQVQVTALRRRDVPETWSHERLRVAVSDVSAVSVRHFSPVRTVALVGAIAILGSTIRLASAETFLGGKRGSGGSTGGSR